MRAIFRVFLLGTVFVALTVPPIFADHQEADCPLSFVGSTAEVTPFLNSPHGTFRNGSVVYLLRGGSLTTLNVTDVGNVDIARQDTIASLAGRESTGGVAYSNGYMYVSSEAGLEIYDLRGVRGGGTEPLFVSRTPGLHYRRLAVMGNVLAGLYPASSLPCVPLGTGSCANSIDLFNITDRNAPTLTGRILSNGSLFVAFEDIVFANGYLFATGLGGTFAFDVSNPSLPRTVLTTGTRGTFLATNGTNLLAIGQETLIGVFFVGPAFQLGQFAVYTLPSIPDRSNELMFHPEAHISDVRLITLIDEKDPLTLNSARTIAFDVFDFSVPLFEGSDDRIYENVSFTFPDEVKYDPIAIGPYVYVLGEISGTQTWGACGQIAGLIEFDTLTALNCGGAEIRGTVTGAKKITNVQLFLDGNSLGNARLGRVRPDISSATPVVTWRISVNMDSVAAGVHVLRAVGTDVDGNVRQFASQTVNFGGPGSNCTNRRRSTSN